MPDRLQGVKDFCFSTERDARNERLLVLWSLLWMGSWIALKLATEAGWLGDGPGVTVAAVPCVLLGFGPFYAYRRFLRDADELRRKIELDALGLAFGVGIVGGISYDFLTTIDLLARADLQHVLLAMILTYVIGVIAGHRRYG